MKLLLAALAASLAVAVTTADAQPRRAPFGPTWTCFMRGLAAAPPTRAPNRWLTFSFTAATQNIARFGVAHACRTGGAVPDSCVPAGCQFRP